MSYKNTVGPFQERFFYDCDTAEITSQSGVFWFLSPPRMLFVNTPVYVVVLWVMREGGGGALSIKILMLPPGQARTVRHLIP